MPTLKLWWLILWNSGSQLVHTQGPDFFLIIRSRSAQLNTFSDTLVFGHGVELVCRLSQVSIRQSITLQQEIALQNESFVPLAVHSEWTRHPLLDRHPPVGNHYCRIFSFYAATSIFEALSAVMATYGLERWMKTATWLVGWEMRPLGGNSSILSTCIFSQSAQTFLLAAPSTSCRKSLNLSERHFLKKMLSGHSA